MAKPRKLDQRTTTMKVLWMDKDLMSSYKKKIKRSDGSIIEGFEADLSVFHRIINQYVKDHPLKEDNEPKSTYLGQQKHIKHKISLKRVS